jgi:hypothetical protein
LMAPLLVAIALSWTPTVPARNNALIQATRGTGNLNQGLVPAGFFGLGVPVAYLVNHRQSGWRMVTSEGRME